MFFFRIPSHKAADGLVRVREKAAVLPGNAAAVSAEVGALGDQGLLAFFQPYVLLQDMILTVEEDQELSTVEGDGEQIGDQRSVFGIELGAVSAAVSTG